MRHTHLRAALALTLVPLLLAGPLASTAVPPLPEGVYALPPAEAWLAAAVSGEPLALQLGDEGTLLLSLQPNEGLIAGPVKGADGNDIDLSGTHALRGEVVGEPGSIVAATVFDGMVLGHIDAPSVGVITLAQTSEPVAVTPAAGAQLPHGRLAEPLAEADPFEFVNGNHDLMGTLKCLQPYPHAAAPPLGLVSGWSQRSFDISVAVDSAFTTEWGASWASVATSWMNSVDLIYQRDLSMRLTVIDMHAHAASVFPGTESNVLLANSKSHYDAAHATMFRENVHLLTGKEVTNALGQANCIGGAGNRAIAYTMGQAANFDPINFFGFSIYGDGYMKIIGHEMGHILSGHHHYGNCAEATAEFRTSRPGDVCTLMFPYVDFITPRFGSVNRLVERGWADAYNL